MRTFKRKTTLRTSEEKTTLKTNEEKTTLKTSEEKSTLKPSEEKTALRTSEDVVIQMRLFGSLEMVQQTLEFSGVLEDGTGILPNFTRNECSSQSSLETSLVLNLHSKRV